MSDQKLTNLSKQSFRDVMRQFESAVAAFDEADLDVEAAIQAYERANTLLAELEKRLKNAQAKVKTITAQQ